VQIEQYIDKLNALDWNQYSGPEYYDSEEVHGALLQLITLSLESENTNVYNRVLFAVGNNHGGTYYPAILGALEFIVSVAVSHETEIARNCALNMLIDIYASFEAEMGAYKLISEQELNEWVKSQIESVKPELVKNCSKSMESSRNKGLAMELIECMEEE